MSVLIGKKVFLVGEEDPLLLSVEKTLQEENAVLIQLSYQEIDLYQIKDNNPDLILLISNSEDDATQSNRILDELRGANLTKVIPILVLLNTESQERIEEVLNRGAADYVTQSEGLDSMVQKMEAILGQGSNLSGDSVIDISSHEPKLTKKGIRVYTIEDDPLLRNLLSVRFDRSGLIYEFNVDGQNCIPEIKQFKPDLILLDLMLPGKNGFDVLAEIKETPEIKSIPVIVFSNRDGQQDRERATHLGAVGFYIKAMTDLAELVETIEFHVQK